MTREEAIETIKRNCTEGSQLREACAMFIPELKESEDEMHRKWILEYLYDGLRKADEEFKDHFKLAIDWFEKQKECLADDSKILESEDERIRKEIVDYLNLVGKGDGDYAQPMIDKWIAYLEKQKDASKAIEAVDRIDKQEEQKPAEWNEEDKLHLNNAIRATMSEWGFDSSTSMWLKFLPERFSLQPKQEWSEDDEKMIDKICHAILVSTYHEKGLTLSEMNQCQSWMHNLSQKAVPSNKRDRWLISRALEYVSMSNENDELKKEIKVCLERRQPQYHWKPSEEQMGALNYAYGELFKREDVGHNILGPLQNLIDTLSKL